MATLVDTPVFIGGLGVYLPDTVSVATAVERQWYPAEAARTSELTGVAVAGPIPAPEMALWAAQDALKRSGHRGADLDLLLYVDTWHQGPDGWLPQSYLQRHLDAPDVLATEIHSGCNGVLVALQLAAGQLAAGSRTALIVAADNFGTPKIDRWTVGEGYIPGDAAAAAVLTREPGFAQLLSVCAVSVPEAEEMHRAGEELFPPPITLGRDLDFTARATSFREQLKRDGVGTSSLLKVHGQTMAVADRALAEAGITLADVHRVLFLNFSRPMVEQRCMAALGLPLERSVWDFGRTVGHLGASDHLVALEHLVTTGQAGPGDHLLLLGLGPGVHLAAAVVKLLDQPAGG
ncbi:ketoacyl-ACP synthase III family protein [Dactylosporangium sp. NPDC051541]|uniref:ketoacyl-ACP synthase III family protein n=1 Tax=Dactylosporangium sp. NPDC051541 TaxID=3363977 RepID=UPI00379310F9